MKTIRNFLFLMFTVFALQSASLAVELFDQGVVYDTAGTVVRFSEYDAGLGQYRVAHFENKWYTSATSPSFIVSGGPWKNISGTILLAFDPGKVAVSGNVETPQWNAEASYPGGSVVSYDGACHSSKWWTTDEPGADTPWESGVACLTGTINLIAVSEVVINPATGVGGSTDDTDDMSDAGDMAGSGDDVVDNGDVTSDAGDTGNGATCDQESTIPQWNESGIYLEGNLVVNNGTYYKSKWWNNNDEPPADPPSPPWSSPWIHLGACAPVASTSNVAIDDVSSEETIIGLPSDVTLDPVPVDESKEGGPTEEDYQQATDAAAEMTDTNLTPIVPPVILEEVAESQAVNVAAPTSLPGQGYEFLSLVSSNDWDWLFPLRSGKTVGTEPCAGEQFLFCGGATRNQPPIAAVDGSTDTFTLNAFIRAVLEYNAWAQLNNYKQFLNEGTLKQQAEEFITFWAKSSRETSGSWSTANAPWIVNTVVGSETLTVWKGGLYWVEEVGYTTNADGTSPAIGYVDAGSALYPPVNGRSYYGRGVIQLSWNYNYGAFSYWLYDNGLFVDIVPERDTLLKLPNLVAEQGALSIMSGIWFWMTPQGAKPSSHDVIYGEVTNISATTQQQGLPQTNSAYIPKTAVGESSDEEVFAYRLGTVINIVNGGLECNRAAKWHGGPVQRVHYYDTYAAYFNAQYNVNATRLTPVKADSRDAWTNKVSDDSDVILQSATCFNQKSYYGW